MPHALQMTVDRQHGKALLRTLNQQFKSASTLAVEWVSLTFTLLDRRQSSPSPEAARQWEAFRMLVVRTPTHPRWRV